jgi:hypothetical protein
MKHQHLPPRCVSELLWRDPVSFHSTISQRRQRANTASSVADMVGGSRSALTMTQYHGKPRIKQDRK